MSPIAERRVHNAVMHGYRTISGDHYMEGQSMRSDDDVICGLAAMAPVTILRLQRMLLAIRVAVKAPMHLIVSLCATVPNKILDQCASQRFENLCKLV